MRRLAVHRGRRCSHDLPDIVLNCRLEDIEGAVDQDLDRLSRCLGTPGDSQSCLMEDVVHTLYRPINQRAVTNISLYDLHAPLVNRPSEIVPASTDKVVDDPDLVGSCRQKLIDNRASDEACSACDETTRTAKFTHLPSEAPDTSLRSRITRAGTPATTAYSGTSCVTTEPAPTMECAPMCNPGRTHAFIPISAPNPTVTGLTTRSVLMIGSPNGEPV